MSMWKSAVDLDKTKTYLARNEFEQDVFWVKYNKEWGCWALKDNPNMLIRVAEVWV